MHTLIGLCGFKKSGKDTVADWLVEHHGYSKLSFARALKEGTKAFFGWTDEHFTDIELKERVDPIWGVSPRQALQWLGTEGLREGMPSAFPGMSATVGRDFWVKRLELDVLSRTGPVVITDMRFMNEIEAVVRWGGSPFFVYRPSVVPLRFEHASEDLSTQMGMIPNIRNVGSLDDLYSSLEVLFGPESGDLPDHNVL